MNLAVQQKTWLQAKGFAVYSFQNATGAKHKLTVHFQDAWSSLDQVINLQNKKHLRDGSIRCLPIEMA